MAASARAPHGGFYTDNDGAGGRLLEHPADRILRIVMTTAMRARDNVEDVRCTLPSLRRPLAACPLRPLLRLCPPHVGCWLPCADRRAGCPARQGEATEAGAHNRCIDICATIFAAGLSIRLLPCSFNPLPGHVLLLLSIRAKTAVWRFMSA